MKLSNLIVVRIHRDKEAVREDIYLADGKFVDKYKTDRIIFFHDAIAYPCFINIHDHLVSNWLPLALPHRPYRNSNIWVEDMKNSFSFKERDKFWHNDGSFNLLRNNGIEMAMLGVYKNIFSGVAIVQDHIPKQDNKYYDSFPIEVVRDYHQVHSVTLNNWWGGEELENEVSLCNEKTPFIIHLGEGTDYISKSEFVELKKRVPLKDNMIFIHCVALDRNDFQEIKKHNVNIAWCPSSNFNLLDRTLDIDTVIELGINVSIGTDSTMSGSINLFNELKLIRDKFPDVPSKVIFKMITSNPAKALNLKNYSGKIESGKQANLLITARKNNDSYENIFELYPSDIYLMLYQGRPILGLKKYLDYFEIIPENYYFYNKDGKQYFVIGHPERILAHIEQKLGYRKDFAFLPF